MVNQAVPDGIGGALPEGQIADAVLPHVVGKGNAQNVGHGGQQVAQADGFLHHGAGPDLRRPANQQGHPVAAFVNVCLVAPEPGAGVVAVGQQFRDVGNGGAAVVRGKEQNGVFPKAQGFQMSGDLPYGVVAHEAEVPIGVGVGFPLEFRGGQNGRVRRGQGKIQEKRLFPVLGDKRLCLFHKSGQHLLEMKIRSAGAGPGKGRSRAPGEGVVGQGGGVVVFQIAVGRHIQRSADSEKAVKTKGRGAVLDGDRKIHPVPGKEKVRTLLFGVVSPKGPVHTQMPFANTAGDIAIFPQKAGDGFPPCLNQMEGIPAQYAVFQAAAPVIPAGKDAVSGRSTQSRGGVGIGEKGPLPCQPVQTGGLKSGLGIQAGNVSPAHIVCENINQIGFVHEKSSIDAKLCPISRGIRENSRRGLL